MRDEQHYTGMRTRPEGVAELPPDNPPRDDPERQLTQLMDIIQYTREDDPHQVIIEARLAIRDLFRELRKRAEQ